MSVLSNHNTYRNQQSNFFKILTLARNEVLYHHSQKNITLHRRRRLWTLHRRKKNKNATRIKSEKTVLHLRLFEETSLLIFHVCTSSHSFADFPKCRKEGAHCTSSCPDSKKREISAFCSSPSTVKGSFAASLCSSTEHQPLRLL